MQKSNLGKFIDAEEKDSFHVKLIRDCDEIEYITDVLKQKESKRDQDKDKVGLVLVKKSKRMIM
jgi:hypothetical protein